MYEYKSLQLVAYDRLKDMIYSCELEFDTVYSETKLASELNISRTPIRDALNRLVFEHYIDILPNRGFQLHRPNRRELTEAYHIRLMCERYCVGLLAQNYRDPDAQIAIEKMRQALAYQRELSKNEDDDVSGQFWIADRAFHSAPLEYLKISAFSTQYDTFLHFFMPHTLGTDEKPPRRLTSLVEHQRILDAIAQGDTRAAYEAVLAHLDASIALQLRPFHP